MRSTHEPLQILACSWTNEAARLLQMPIPGNEGPKLKADWGQSRSQSRRHTRPFEYAIDSRRRDAANCEHGAYVQNLERHVNLHRAKLLDDARGHTRRDGQDNRILAV